MEVKKPSSDHWLHHNPVRDPPQIEKTPNPQMKMPFLTVYIVGTSGHFQIHRNFSLQHVFSLQNILFWNFLYFVLPQILEIITQSKLVFRY